MRVFGHCYLSTAATVSVPTGVSVAEDGGTVRVCAMLTLSPSAGTSTAANVTIALATSNGEE